MRSKTRKMSLTVAKWGNSLAVRLPVGSAKAIGVREGDTLIAEVSAEGRLVLEAEGKAIEKGAIARLRRFLESQPQTQPVVADMRTRTRY